MLKKAIQTKANFIINIETHDISYFKSFLGFKQHRVVKKYIKKIIRIFSLEADFRMCVEK